MRGFLVPQRITRFCFDRKFTGGKYEANPKKYFPQLKVPYLPRHQTKSQTDITLIHRLEYKDIEFSRPSPASLTPQESY